MHLQVLQVYSDADAKVISHFGTFLATKRIVLKQIFGEISPKGFNGSQIKTSN